MVKKNNRPKVLKPSVQQKRRAKKKTHLVPKCGSEEVLKNWDFKKTLAENYKSLGLVADVNVIPTRMEKFKAQTAAEIAEQERREHVMKKRLARGKPAINPADGALASMLSRIQEAEPAAPRKIKSMPVREQFILQKLLAKHKEDLHAMERDIKINVYQWTEGHLSRRIKLYQELQGLAAGGAGSAGAESDAEESMAVEEADK